MDEFKSRIPDLAQSLREHIDEAHKKNKRFRGRFRRVYSSLPGIPQSAVEKLLDASASITPSTCAAITFRFVNSGF
jgi:hypothetical protein